jgi:hypothetical protein
MANATDKIGVSRMPLRNRKTHGLRVKLVSGWSEAR